VTEEYVPTQTEIWDFLVGLKQTTESGFQRMESQIAEVRSDVERRLNSVERRLVRIDDRLAGLEDLTIRQRLEDHEGRITSLEHRNI
jgi:hypothetical protein